MANKPAGDIELKPIGGEAQTVDEWLLMFHLAVVVIDPYTYESAWLLEASSRIMRFFADVDTRIAWVVTSDEKGAAEFMGPLGEEFLTLVDPEREFVKSLGLETLPAFVHLATNGDLIGSAEGWDPPAWREVASGLSEANGWTRVVVPHPKDPAPFVGSPALG